jgi:hypothetical protein
VAAKEVVVKKYVVRLSLEERAQLNVLDPHKHGSWLDMAEAELGVLSAQCLDRRIPDKQTLTGGIAAWEINRNANHAMARKQS